MINEPILDWKAWKGMCVICKKKIDTNKEKYVKLTDYEGKKEVSYCIYHLDCWRNRFVITQQNINQMANEWMNKITNLTGGKIEV